MRTYCVFALPPRFCSSRVHCRLLSPPRKAEGRCPPKRKKRRRKMANAKFTSLGFAEGYAQVLDGTIHGGKSVHVLVKRPGEQVTPGSRFCVHP